MKEAGASELEVLMTKLYSIQEEVGGKEKEKGGTKTKASAGRGDKGARFNEVKGEIVDLLKKIHDMIKDAKEKDSSLVGAVTYGYGAKEKVAAQQTIRETIRQLGDHWKVLDGLFRSEAKKKRSKFTKDELSGQQTLVLKLQQEIEKVKELQRTAFSKVAPLSSTTANMAIPAFDTAQYSDIKSGDSNWTSGGGGANLSEEQKDQILELERRDADFDRQIELIAEGVQDLAEIAALQSEEARRQNHMLQGTNEKLDSVAERLTNVNVKLKSTLTEVGRAGDKLMVDIMCIVSLSLHIIFHSFPSYILAYPFPSSIE